MNAPLRLSLVLPGLLLVSSLLAHAQTIAVDPPSEGSREFWVVFQKNFRDSTVDGRTQVRTPADPLMLHLAITAQQDARGYVEIPGLGIRTTFIVKGGGMAIVPVDPAAQLRSSGVVEKLGVHVLADVPIMVYGSDRRFQTTDSYLAYPVEPIGRSYRAVCYRWLQNDLLAQVAVVATENGTKVRIMPTARVATIAPASRPAPTVNPASPPAGSAKAEPKLSDGSSTMKRTTPSADGSGESARMATSIRKPEHTAEPDVRMVARASNVSASIDVKRPVLAPAMLPARKPADLADRTVFTPASGIEPIEITLNKGEVYQIIAQYIPSTLSDLTGSLIESDKPVAVFSGHNCAYVPDPSVKACNLLVEQMPPISTWGREYYVGTLSGRSSSVVRVVASEEGTHVVENGKDVATLAAGEYYENIDQRVPLAITSDRPVLVAQFSKGFDNGDDVGDPMMTVISPVSQYNSSYRFATPLTGSWHNFVNVVVPTAARGELRLDGVVIADSLFHGDGGRASGAIEVKEGPHTITCTVPFGITCYGFGYDATAYDAYGNAGSYMVERPAR